MHVLVATILCSQVGKKGEKRVVITMNGKFLPHVEQIAADNTVPGQIRTGNVNPMYFNYWEMPMFCPVPSVQPIRFRIAMNCLQIALIFVDLIHLARYQALETELVSKYRKSRVFLSEMKSHWMSKL